MAMGQEQRQSWASKTGDWLKRKGIGTMAGWPGGPVGMIAGAVGEYENTGDMLRSIDEYWKPKIAQTALPEQMAEAKQFWGDQLKKGGLVGAAETMGKEMGNIGMEYGGKVLFGENAGKQAGSPIPEQQPTGTKPDMPVDNRPTIGREAAEQRPMQSPVTSKFGESEVTLEQADIDRVRSNREADASMQQIMAQRRSDAPRILGLARLSPVLQASEKEKATKQAQFSRVGKTNQQLDAMDKEAQGLSLREQQINENRQQMLGIQAAGQAAAAGGNDNFETKEVPIYDEKGKRQGTELRTIDKRTGKEVVDEERGNIVNTPETRKLQAEIAEDEAQISAGDKRRGLFNYKSREDNLASNRARLDAITGRKRQTGQGVDTTAQSQQAQQQADNTSVISNLENWIKSNPNDAAGIAQAKAQIAKLRG